MTTSENNVAAQAGDDPMRTAFIAAFPRAVWDEENQSFNEQMYNYAFVGFRTAQVSPRATAEVERELIQSIIEDGYLSDTNTARGHAILATTKPGA